MPSVTQTVSLRDDAEAADLSDGESTQTDSLRYGIKLNPLQKEIKPAGLEYKYVNLILNREQRYADLTVRGPEADLPTNRPRKFSKLGDSYWPLQAYRELDHALLHLRVNEPEIGLVCLRTQGDIDDVLAAIDKTLVAQPGPLAGARDTVLTWRACCAVLI